MSKVQELLHLKEEIRATVSGLNQELKEIISKYNKLLSIDSIHVNIMADGTDKLIAEAAFGLADDECDPEVLSILEEPIFTDDAEVNAAIAQPDVENVKEMKNEIDLTGDDEDEVEIPLQVVPVKLLGTKAHLTLAHRNSKSKALLFEAHPILQ